MLRDREIKQVVIPQVGQTTSIYADNIFTRYLLIHLLYKQLLASAIVNLNIVKLTMA